MIKIRNNIKVFGIMNKDLTIKFIKKACINRKIFWTKHVMERMGRRGIYKADIISCIMSGEIIEEYPSVLTRS